MRIKVYTDDEELITEFSAGNGMFMRGVQYLSNDWTTPELLLQNSGPDLFKTSRNVMAVEKYIKSGFKPLDDLHYYYIPATDAQRMIELLRLYGFQAGQYEKTAIDQELIYQSVSPLDWNKVTEYTPEKARSYEMMIMTDASIDDYAVLVGCMNWLPSAKRYLDNQAHTKRDAFPNTFIDACQNTAKYYLKKWKRL